MKYLVTILFIGLISNAQNIRINEVVSSNSVFFDEDGDTPDWIELHNSGTQNVNLENWTISDDLNNLSKWSFPNITIPANDYLMLWASNKDRNQITSSRTLVNQGDLYKYQIPTSELNANWTHLDFDDTNWDNGISGFGYADNDDATIIPNGTSSIYIRKNFDLNSVEDIISLILDIDYDDGFVAYINGIEIARANINGVPPPYNASTNQDHEAQMYNGGLPDRFQISDFSSILVECSNVLAIQAHNISPYSSDFTVIPFLSAIYSSANSSGIDPPEILNLIDNNFFHTNFKISTTSETLTLSDNNGTIVDQLIVEGLPPNTSIGVSNFSNSIVFYTDTTPNAQNANTQFLGAIQNEVIFSENGGLKTQPISLSLSGNQANQVIRYTIDGSTPNEQSLTYNGTINISENTSVRARIYAPNYLPSKTGTESYILGANHNIDIMLLSVKPGDFFDDYYGIYVFGPEGTYSYDIPYFGANFWEDWERPIHFSFYENNSY